MAFSLPQAVLIAFSGGILPALVWLWFWLKQDSRRPEPFGLLALSFFAGIMGVLITFPIQKWLYGMLVGPVGAYGLQWTPLVVVALAGVEEVVKYTVAYAVAFRTRYFDEPIDAMIYLITVALGFAAMENFAYVISALGDGDLYNAALNAHLRFLGATLIHVAASASIGFAVGLSFYRRRRRKVPYLFAGILTAVILHALFNLSIINSTTGTDVLSSFFYFWIIVVVIILLFEKIKRVKKPVQAR